MGRPRTLGGPLEVPGERGSVADEIEVAVAPEVRELLQSAAELRGRGELTLELRRCELTLAEVRLVVPGALGGEEDAGDALAVEVGPLAARTFDAARDALEARSIDISSSWIWGLTYPSSSGGSVARRYSLEALSQTYPACVTDRRYVTTGPSS
jgi:hypothetical protein